MLFRSDPIILENIQQKVLSCLNSLAGVCCTVQNLRLLLSLQGSGSLISMSKTLGKGDYDSRRLISRMPFSLRLTLFLLSSGEPFISPPRTGCLWGADRIQVLMMSHLISLYLLSIQTLDSALYASNSLQHDIHCEPIPSSEPPKMHTQYTQWFLTYFLSLEVEKLGGHSCQQKH